MSYIAKLLPASFVSGFLLLTAGVLPVHAQFDTGLEDVGAGAGLSDAPLPEVIGSLIQVALGLLGIVFLVLILYAGFLWMTARGEKDNVEKAQKLMTQAVIGLVIIIAAYAISTFVMGAIADSFAG